jgi:predicted dehydrogenase
MNQFGKEYKTQPVKIGLIGCGRIAQLVHLKNLNHLPGARLVALADIDQANLKKASRLAPQAATVENYSELLAMPEVDAVLICLPNALHAEAAIAALKQGKHVYLEKPLATNLDDARAVLSAWEASGKIGMIGFNYRFNPLHQKLRRILQSADLKSLTAVRTVFSTHSLDLPDWRKNLETGGGVLSDLAAHHVDLIHFIFGCRIKKIFARLRSQSSEWDSAALELELESGLIVQSFFSLNSIEEDRFDIYSKRGKLSVDRYRSLDVEVTDSMQRFFRIKQLSRRFQSLFHGGYAVKRLLSPGHEPSYWTALENFVQSIDDNESIHPDFWDGYLNVSILEAAKESLTTGRAISPEVIIYDHEKIMS